MNVIQFKQLELHKCEELFQEKKEKDFLQPN